MDTTALTLRQQQDFQFAIDFGAPVPPLLADEPPPLGASAGPSPVQLLAAAVGNCLCDSLLFAARKYHQRIEPLTGEVHWELGRDAGGRLRVQGMDVTLTLGQPAAGVQHLDRILGGFEAFCTVTQSVRQAFAVRVTVVDVAGRRLTPPAA